MYNSNDEVLIFILYAYSAVIQYIRIYVQSPGNLVSTDEHGQIQVESVLCGMLSFGCCPSSEKLKPLWFFSEVDSNKE